MQKYERGFSFFQGPPLSPGLVRQPSVGNVLARTTSSGSSTGSPTIQHSGSGTQRQGSQSSLFEHFASHAKELVRETTRQSSQDGLLAQVDKVSGLNEYLKISKLMLCTFRNFQCYNNLFLPENLTLNFDFVSLYNAII